MKTSTALFLTDILPHRRGFYNKIVKNKILEEGKSIEAYKAMKAAGIEGVELFLPSYITLSPTDFKELRVILDEQGFPVFSVHQQLRFLSLTRIDEIEELCKIATSLAAGVIVLHMSSSGKQVFDPKFVEAIHALEKKYNLKAGFENREKYFGSYSAPYGWDEHKFAALMEKNDFSITLDTTHLAQAGGDIVAFFKKNKHRIVNIHISDYKEHPLNSSLRPLRFKHLPLGKGELPIDEFLKTLHDEKYKGLITMEIHTDLHGICESAKIINAITKK